jgi:DNA-binding CsgD family transcriptional regulator
MRPSDLHHVTRLLYQAVSDSSQWTRALAATADLLAAGHVLLGFRNDTSKPQLLSAGADRAQLSDYWQKLGDSPFRNVIPHVPAATALHGYSVIDEATLITSEFYQSVTRALDGHYAICGVPYRSRTDQTFVAACRPLSKGDFTKRAQADLQVLMPHIETALRLRSRLEHTESAAWHREHVLDRLAIGVVLLDQRQHPLVVNAKARALFAMRDGIVLGRDHVAASSMSVTRVLQRAVATAADLHALADVDSCIRIERPSKLPPFLVRVAPAQSNDEQFTRWPQAAVAMFIDTLESHQLQPRLLRAWFGLSMREAELAALLANGVDLKACAQIMAVGLETVRTHLDGLFSKTRTRRQAELVSVLLRTAWRL